MSHIDAARGFCRTLLLVATFASSLLVSIVLRHDWVSDAREVADQKPLAAAQQKKIIVDGDFTQWEKKEFMAHYARACQQNYAQMRRSCTSLLDWIKLDAKDTNAQSSFIAMAFAHSMFEKPGCKQSVEEVAVTARDDVTHKKLYLMKLEELQTCLDNCNIDVSDFIAELQGGKGEFTKSIQTMNPFTLKDNLAQRAGDLQLRHKELMDLVEAICSAATDNSSTQVIAQPSGSSQLSKE